MTESPDFPPDMRDADSAEWWDAIDRRKLLIPHCDNCGRSFFPSASHCPHCNSDQVTLVPSQGKGTVYSWVVVHRALDPAFADEVPYTVLTVELAEGVRLIGRQTAGPEPQPGSPVTASFYEAGGRVLLGFEVEAG